MPVILFDLDGTLLDSSHDLLAAVNDVRAERAMAPVPLEQVRGSISQGARAILAAGIPELDVEERAELLEHTIEIYRGHIGRHGDLFPGIATVLDTIEALGSRWGVVTNKREDLARIVLENLNLTSRCAVLIGGDTLARCKPDPLPVQVACERLQVLPQHVVFIGDDQRDIQAGQSAGTRTAAVCWGFHPAGEDPAQWEADAVLTSTEELLYHPVLRA